MLEIPYQCPNLPVYIYIFPKWFIPTVFNCSSCIWFCILNKLRPIMYSFGSHSNLLNGFILIWFLSISCFQINLGSFSFSFVFNFNTKKKKKLDWYRLEFFFFFKNMYMHAFSRFAFFYMWNVNDKPVFVFLLLLLLFYHFNI